MGPSYRAVSILEKWSLAYHRADGLTEKEERESRREGESSLSLKYPNLRHDILLRLPVLLVTQASQGVKYQKAGIIGSHAGVWLPQVATGLLRIFVTYREAKFRNNILRVIISPELTKRMFLL